MRARIFFAALTLALGASCYDPVHSDAVDALGPEADGIPRGPRHRAGQPCTTCHGGSGPGSPELSVAGTVFAVRGTTVASAPVTVTVTDATGATRSAATNEVGNFFITKSDWAPVFPLHVAIDGDGAHKNMVTTIGRDGGCATCHRGQGDTTSMPGVFLRDQ